MRYAWTSQILKISRRRAETCYWADLLLVFHKKFIYPKFVFVCT